MTSLFAVTQIKAKSSHLAATVILSAVSIDSVFREEEREGANERDQDHQRSYLRRNIIQWEEKYVATCTSATELHRQ